MPTGIYLHKKGMIHSEETKEKIRNSEYHKNLFLENNPFYGKHHTDYVKLKIRLAHLGKKISENHKKKISLKMTGKLKSQSHKKNISLSKFGKSSPIKNKKLSIEHISKIKKSVKKAMQVKRIREKHLNGIFEASKRGVYKINRSKRIFPIKDTQIELKIQNYLKLLHVEFMTHYYISDITHSYQCDILIPSRKTIIECDGCYWHGCSICNKNLNEKQIEQIEKDDIRTKELLEKGYKIIRLWEHNVKKMDLNDFKEKIEGGNKNGKQ